MQETVQKKETEKVCTVVLWGCVTPNKDVNCKRPYQKRDARCDADTTTMGAFKLSHGLLFKTVSQFTD